MPLSGLGAHPNLLVLLTDQQRATRYLPDEFVRERLPSFVRLESCGVSFANHFTASCMCAPSRATMWTGVYPAQHGVTHTFGPPPGSALPGASLATAPFGMRETFLPPSRQLPNLASILRAAGYEVVYKGKWHLSGPVDRLDWAPADIQYLETAYGFSGWNPPDSGNSVSAPFLPTLGGGSRYDNDLRCVAGGGTPPGIAGGESVLDFLERKREGAGGPFCLIVSLVNPHDVWVAPHLLGRAAGGYAGAVPDLGIPVPGNVDASLLGCPSVQREFRTRFDRASPIDGVELRQQYVNFYAHLQVVVDALLVRILDRLDAAGLTHDTVVVRLADHGEMALAHGLRQKDYNAYDETLRIPLVFSNPRAFPSARCSPSFASTVDLLPTLLEIAGVEVPPGSQLRGRSLVPELEDPGGVAGPGVHHFTADDGDEDLEPGRIRAVRTERWKYAAYHSRDGVAREYELYDLLHDPAEDENLAADPRHRGDLAAMRALLAEVMVSAGTAPARLP